MGRARNPYVSPAREKSFYERYPWKQDGWAAAIVLTRNHRFETFAWYLVALLRYDEPARPDLALVRSLRVRAAFAKELASAGREFANDAWTLPDMYEHRPQLLAPANVPDPIRAFLV